MTQALGQHVRVLAGGDHDQHAVGDEPPHHEQQRAQRRRVGPVRVVDDQHDRMLEPAQALEGQRARADVVAAELDRVARAPQELLERPEGEVALGLVDEAASSTVTSSSGARKRSIRAVLPRPAGPSSTTTRGRPSRACASSDSKALSSWRRPTKTACEAALSCGCVAMLSGELYPYSLVREPRHGWGFPCRERFARRPRVRL